MQWKQMPWPIMVDSLNLLGVKVVPYTLFIDEHGVIRAVKPKHDALESFLNTKYPAPEKETIKAEKPDADMALKAWRAMKEPDFEAAMNAGQQLFLWSGDRDAAVDAFSAAAKANPKSGEAAFSLGVALRRRLESPARKEDDFARAVECWERSLQSDPNHYIRRR
jgi:tetratricopeptide (TPR) repeat protein